MPEWGLTREQRQSSPWGIDEHLLYPHKKITDPVHGDVYLNRLEVAILDTAPMQRLRRVRQLGTTHLVYPSATHTRFSHALGTLRAAQNLMDVVLAQETGRDPVDDVFGEWRNSDQTDGIYNKRVAEATVLARLGALLHDLGHIPFGHTLEDDLSFFDSHDANRPRYDRLWEQLAEGLDNSLGSVGGRDVLSSELVGELRLLILSDLEESEQGASEYRFVADLVGNTICADLIDYLRRDHMHSGLPAALGNRFLDGFYVTPGTRRYMAQRMVIRLKRRDRVRTDVVSELFKYLRYRYELSERALEHHAKLAADVMVSKAMEAWLAAIVSTHGVSAADGKRRMEEEVLLRGDDGLLEFMRYDRMDENQSEEWARVRAIAGLLMDRQLFNSIGTYSQQWMAEELHGSFGTRKEQLKLERQAAEAAGVADDWKIALWVPNPKMRLKPADVLVDYGTGVQIVPLRAWDEANGRRGAEIIESHRNLWSMKVYVDRSVTREQRRVVLDTLRDLLGISEWDVRPDQEDGVIERGSEARAGTGVGLEDRWEVTGRLSLLHPKLRELAASATEGVVTWNDEEFQIKSEDARIRLNLLLFLEEMDNDAVSGTEGRELFEERLKADPERIESLVWYTYPSGASAYRTSGSEDVGHPVHVAIAEAIRMLLGPSDGRQERFI